MRKTAMTTILQDLKTKRFRQSLQILGTREIKITGKAPLRHPSLHGSSDEIGKVESKAIWVHLQDLYVFHQTTSDS
jgi:hypothetical protein